MSKSTKHSEVCLLLAIMSVCGLGFEIRVSSEIQYSRSIMMADMISTRYEQGGSESGSEHRMTLWPKRTADIILSSPLRFSPRAKALSCADGHQALKRFSSNALALEMTLLCSSNEEHRLPPRVLACPHRAECREAFPQLLSVSLRQSILLPSSPEVCAGWWMVRIIVYLEPAGCADIS